MNILIKIAVYTKKYYILKNVEKLSLIGKPTGKRPLGRPRRRCEDNIRMYLKEIGVN